MEDFKLTVSEIESKATLFRFKFLFSCVQYWASKAKTSIVEWKQDEETQIIHFDAYLPTCKPLENVNTYE
jgi:hypothetical protein